jgi:alkanesulfonate monooxygenase SsuD/methylene tetrahydromethanopterin reductase-like flavin-dependent oxidoreductase (luciferase family)
MVFAGEPAKTADRIIDLHHHLGHSRHFLQMDIGGMPHADVLKSIELLGTEVPPASAPNSTAERVVSNIAC